MKMLASFSAFVGKTFAVWVLLFAVLGFVFPETFKQFAPHIVTLLGIIMFSMGLTLSLDDFREVVRRPADVGIGVASQFLIMPLLAVLLTKIIPMSPEVAAGVILVGCCPGGTSSNVMTYLGKGDVALSVACTSVTTLAAPLVTPFLVWFFASQFLPVDAMAMFMSIVKVILVPLALGVLAQKLVPEIVKTAVPCLPLVSVTGIVLIVAAVVAMNKNAIATTGLLIFLVVVLHNGIGYMLGFTAAKLTGMSLAKRKAIAVEVGMQNSGLGAALAAAHFSPLAAVPSAIFSVWHNISGALLANYFARMKDDK
ncbi:bile acid:sodium symporter family protein [Pseudochrobactrum algeriensis]|uniref:bile acid:sodium symporter family protein n=1 Tax=Pseudochrobactrum TaxID=354349 RepID=UPI000950C260|nr:MULTISPECIES: bile acid:sodium symporter family protein [Pseudochrobactrum]MBX8782749.1 bile acid:sodium symporter family protein [Ochrobactrum sp. GRS2]MBX8811497.1 bile acid:sodium symporter family protein [Ochrobactrum sp. MR34]QVQ37928.1 bile acid:sodium symporter family protein [Pseudochrobactrum algeriensis]QVQ41150.1 bile acid:sodium symporter family protein [Pseudochrobactrum algeriensis]QVQ45074.1 bile acid:sodium symporter family protein [Pseudochrobactrum algeriensis]